MSNRGILTHDEEEENLSLLGMYPNGIFYIHLKDMLSLEHKDILHLRIFFTLLNAFLCRLSGEMPFEI